MRAIGIIPARMASARFPGKPLAGIAGHPMLWHVWRAVKSAGTIHPCYVATDSPGIRTTCIELGMDYILTSAFCKNGTERCHDAMRQLKSLPGDVVVNVQCDEPAVRGESLDELVRVFADPAVGVASLCFAPTGPEFIANRDRVKVLVGGDGYALGFWRSANPATPWRSYRQHVGIYAYRREIHAGIAGLEPRGDLEQGAWAVAGHRVRMVEIPYETASVDRPGDVPGAERALAAAAVN